MTRGPHATDSGNYILNYLPKRRRSLEAAGQLLYLPATGVTVVPYQLTEGGWECVVTAASPPPSRTSLTLTHSEIETALPAISGVPALSHPATFAAVWQARVWQDTTTGHGRQAAALLADLAGPTGTFAATPDVRQRLCSTTRLHLVGLERLLDGLVAEGFLTCSAPDGPGGIRTYALSLGLEGTADLLTPGHPTPGP